MFINKITQKILLFLSMLPAVSYAINIPYSKVSLDVESICYPILNNVFCSANGQHCIATGYYTSCHNNSASVDDDALIYISEDGGHHWSLSPLPEDALGRHRESHGISCDKNGNTCTLVGMFINFETFEFSPLVYTSKNGGVTWAEPLNAQSIDTQLFRNVSCSDDGKNCIALACTVMSSTPIIEDRSVVVRSNDSGGSWRADAVIPGTDPVISCNQNGNSCVVIDGNSLLTKNPSTISYTSHDNGESWTPSATPPYIDGAENLIINSVTCDKQNGLKCVAVGDYIENKKTRPVSFTSSDGGNSWQVSMRSTSTKIRSFNYVYCSNDLTHCIALASGQRTGEISKTLISEDGGQTWTTSKLFQIENTPISKNKMLDLEINSVTCEGSMNKCVAVGGFNNLPIMFYSNDGGNSWNSSNKVKFMYE